MTIFLIIFVLVVGLNVGSFLNVVAARLPMEKSLVWPGSRCMSCQQPVRWYDNLPIISYLVLRGRCRSCGAGFSVRYLFVELATGLGLVGLFVLEMIVNIHDWPAANSWQVKMGIFPTSWWIGFGWHALLFCFLMAASVCDLECRLIPLQITVPGTIIGLIGATMMPWPWPRTPAEATPVAAPGQAPGWEWLDPTAGLKGGIYEWPFWGPLPDFCLPGGNWQTGFLTGFIGLLVGTFLLRTIGFVFSKGLGRDALGLGDADLMMMAGAFLGWQPMVAGFFISVLPAVVFGAINVAFRGDNSLPFGPSLAAGVMTASLMWRWVGPYAQPIAFFGTILIALVAIMVVFLFLSSFIIGRVRG
jgi:leader peptidase (prepilin peptidase)/N-methyltransferase